MEVALLHSSQIEPVLWARRRGRSRRYGDQFDDRTGYDPREVNRLFASLNQVVTRTRAWARFMGSAPRIKERQATGHALWRRPEGRDRAAHQGKASIPIVRLRPMISPSSATTGSGYGLRFFAVAKEPAGASRSGRRSYANFYLAKLERLTAHSDERQTRSTT